MSVDRNSKTESRKDSCQNYVLILTILKGLTSSSECRCGCPFTEPYLGQSRVINGVVRKYNPTQGCGMVLSAVEVTPEFTGWNVDSSRTLGYLLPSSLSRLPPRRRHTTLRYFRPRWPDPARVLPLSRITSGVSGLIVVPYWRFGYEGQIKTERKPQLTVPIRY